MNMKIKIIGMLLISILSFPIHTNIKFGYNFYNSHGKILDIPGTLDKQGVNIGVEALIFKYSRFNLGVGVQVNAPKFFIPVYFLNNFSLYEKKGVDVYIASRIGAGAIQIAKNKEKNKNNEKDFYGSLYYAAGLGVNYKRFVAELMYEGAWLPKQGEITGTDHNEAFQNMLSINIGVKLGEFRKKKLPKEFENRRESRFKGGEANIKLGIDAYRDRGLKNRDEIGFVLGFEILPINKGMFEFGIGAEYNFGFTDIKYSNKTLVPIYLLSHINWYRFKESTGSIYTLSRLGGAYLSLENNNSNSSNGNNNPQNGSYGAIYYGLGFGVEYKNYLFEAVYDGAYLPTTKYQQPKEQAYQNKVGFRFGFRIGDYKVEKPKVVVEVNKTGK